MGELVHFPVPPDSPRYVDLLLARCRMGDPEASEALGRYCHSLERKVALLQNQQQEAVAMVEALMDIYEDCAR